MFGFFIPEGMDGERIFLILTGAFRVSSSGILDLAFVAFLVIFSFRPSRSS